MRHFAFSANSRDRLLVSTPTMDKGGALYYTGGEFDEAEFSIGFRVWLNDNQAGTIFENIDTSDNSTNWSLYLTGSELYWYDSTNGEIYICELVVGITYSFWVDVDADDLDIYWKKEGDSLNYLNFTISEITSANSRIYFGNANGLNDTLSGMIWDLAFSAGKISSAGTYIPGGLTPAWTFYWPAREGSGAVCTDLILGVDLSVAGTFTWSGTDTASPKRWS